MCIKDGSQNSDYNDAWYSDELDIIHRSARNYEVEDNRTITPAKKLETSLSEFRTISVIKKAIEVVKQNAETETHHSAEKNQRRYRFTKHERRFLARMKMWVENGLRLSKANIILMLYSKY